MPLPLLASVGALAARLGIEIDEGDARAAAALTDASAAVRRAARRPFLLADDELDEESPTITENDVDIIRAVVLRVAVRLYDNPRGLRQEATGPFSESRTDGSSDPLALTDAEKLMLAGLAAAVGVGLSSVRVEAPAGASGVARQYPWWWEDDEDGDS